MHINSEVVDTKIKGNKVRALIIDLPTKKNDEPGKSKQLAEDNPLVSLQAEGRILEPPFDMYYLTTLSERNSEMGPCIDAMETNIDGFGHYFVSRLNGDAEIDDKTKKEARIEFVKLENFFQNAGYDRSFTKLRRDTRQDIEATGNGYWEVVRSINGEIQYFTHVPSYQVRITPTDVTPIKVDMPIHKLNVDGSISIDTMTIYKRFRRFVQISLSPTRSYSSSSYSQRWFKEFGDYRTYNVETGELVPEEKVKNWDGKGTPMPEELKANEIKHWKIYCSRSAYGLPKFMGSIIDIEGDRKSSEINYITFCNNMIPSQVIAVSNGQLTEDTVIRIQEFMEKIQGDDNRSKVLVIEAEPMGEEGEDSGQVKIDIKSLTDDQHSDAMFQKYSETNREKVRVSWRLPPIFTGRSSDYTRTTAETSRRLADEQIFAPERNEFDNWINRELFPILGAVYYKFKSNSPNTTDNSELVKILGGAEKTGGMTPRIARMVLNDILGLELPPLQKTDTFDPDMPFSLSMAEAVKNQADVTEPSQQVAPTKMLKSLDQTDVIDSLFSLRKHLEEAWSEKLIQDEDE